MKPTHPQLEALTELLEGLTVDHRLYVKIGAAANDHAGVIVTRIQDHWGYEYVRIDRQGLITRSDLAGERDALDTATGQGRR